MNAELDSKNTRRRQMSWLNLVSRYPDCHFAYRCGFRRTLTCAVTGYITAVNMQDCSRKLRAN
jgi:hypothetical protein